MTQQHGRITRGHADVGCCEQVWRAYEGTGTLSRLERQTHLALSEPVLARRNNVVAAPQHDRPRRLDYLRTRNTTGARQAESSDEKGVNGQRQQGVDTLSRCGPHRHHDGGTQSQTSQVRSANAPDPRRQRHGAPSHPQLCRPWCLRPGRPPRCGFASPAALLAHLRLWRRKHQLPWQRMWLLQVAPFTRVSTVHSE